jgi:hypothetical protein
MSPGGTIEQTVRGEGITGDCVVPRNCCIFQSHDREGADADAGHEDRSLTPEEVGHPPGGLGRYMCVERRRPREDQLLCVSLFYPGPRSGPYELVRTADPTNPHCSQRSGTHHWSAQRTLRSGPHSGPYEPALLAAQWHTPLVRTADPTNWSAQRTLRIRSAQWILRSGPHSGPYELVRAVDPTNWSAQRILRTGPHSGPYEPGPRRGIHETEDVSRPPTKAPAQAC